MERCSAKQDIQMNPQEEAAVTFAVEVSKATVVPVAHDIIGLFGGDFIAQKRKENLKRIADKAAQRAKTEGEEFDLRKLNQKTALAFARAAADEDQESLQDVWARLLHRASNEDDMGARAGFIEALDAFDALDARVLEALVTLQRYSDGIGEPTLSQRIAEKLGVRANAIGVALSHLGKLDIVQNPSGGIPGQTGPNPVFTPFGSELVRALFSESEIRNTSVV
jgi:hypothetical protein